MSPRIKKSSSRCRCFFPRQVNAIVEDNGKVDLSVTQSPELGSDQPIVVLFQRHGQTIRVLSYSGHKFSLPLDGRERHFEILATSEGGVILEEDDQAWLLAGNPKIAGYSVRRRRWRFRYEAAGPGARSVPRLGRLCRPWRGIRALRRVRGNRVGVGGHTCDVRQSNTYDPDRSRRRAGEAGSLRADLFQVAGSLALPLSKNVELQKSVTLEEMTRLHVSLKFPAVQRRTEILARLFLAPASACRPRLHWVNCDSRCFLRARQRNSSMRCEPGTRHRAWCSSSRP